MQKICRKRIWEMEKGSDIMSIETNVELDCPDTGFEITPK